MATDEDVTVPFGDNPGDTAVALLAAAEDAGLPANVVRTTGDGTFIVPASLAKKAKADTIDPGQQAVQGTVAGQVDQYDPNPQPAKKAAPKAEKTATKTATKSATKTAKSTAKKATSKTAAK